MWQRVYQGGVNRKHGVEQVSQPNAVSFCRQPEECAVAIEAPWPPLLDDL